MSDPELVKEVARWLRYGRDGLKAAELLLEHGQVPRAACFNAQQCAEKAIKGSLIFLQIDFPKTHNLSQLCRLLPDGWVLGEDPDRFSDLSNLAVEPRYPGDMPEATVEDARSAVRQAREAYDTTLEDLERHGYEPEENTDWEGSKS